MAMKRHELIKKAADEVMGLSDKALSARRKPLMHDEGPEEDENAETPDMEAREAMAGTEDKGGLSDEDRALLERLYAKLG